MVSALLFAAGLGLATCPGCGGDPPPPAKSASAPQSVKALVFYVPMKGLTGVTASVAQAVQMMLIKSGCKVVTSETEPHDLVAALDVSATPVQQVVKIRFGNSPSSTDYKVSVALKVMAGTRLVDRFATAFESEGGQVSESQLADLSHGVASSPAIAAFGDELPKQRAEAEARKKAETEAAAKAERDKEEAMWRAANIEGCRNATTLTACNAVTQYIKAYPNGVHVAEGRQAWQLAEPKFRVMAEQAAWSRVDLAGCKSPTDATSCDGAKEYVRDFPSGAHVGEARAAVDVFTKKWQAKEKADAERAKQEAAKEAAANARQEQEACKRTCRKETCNYMARSYEICVSRCIQAECQ